MTFSDFNLKPEILKAVTDLGYETPTPIQVATLSKLVDQTNDFIALAQTGTGKTAAFSIPILQNINLDLTDVQAFILSPTRELALQIARDILGFSKYMPGLHVQAVYGGASIRDQIAGLKQNPQIVVGTPGRVLDMINKNKLKVGSIRWLVLDEADEMLSMGFKDELDAILGATPEERQTFLFSATMPEEVKQISKNYMNLPETISVGQANTSNKNIEHQYYLVDGKDKYQALKMLVDSNPDVYGIIFCKTKIDTQEIADLLGRDGYNADALHGDLVQSQRDFVMNKFKSGQLQLLVATDVAARGLDVSNLTHVINFSLPDDPEVYIHRTGRTGRAGKKGIAMSIITKKEQSKMLAIERMIKLPVTYTRVPDGNTICEAQLMHLINSIKAVEVDEDIIKPFMKVVNNSFSELDKETILKKFISEEFFRFLKYYQGLKDVNARVEQPSRREDFDFRSARSSGGQGGSRPSGEFVTMKINHGKSSGLKPKTLLKFINDITPGKKIVLGTIEIEKDNSIFEVRKDQVSTLIKCAETSGMRGLVITEAQGRKAVKSSGGGEPQPAYRHDQSRSGGKPFKDKKRSDKPKWGSKRK
jgi:ATP-dependent RNA helicase DeaD